MLSAHPVDVGANSESATVELAVREDEEIDPDTLALDAARSRASGPYGSETRMSPAILSLASTTLPSGWSGRSRKTR